MSVQTSVQPAKARVTFLGRVLQANGIFSGLSGLALIVDAGPIATFLGINAPWVLAAIGVGLVIYAIDLFWIASREPIDARFATGAIVMDGLWVLGSILLLVTDWVPFTDAGKWTVGIVADLVATFAILQFIGLRRK
jgi:hypothetical protein